MGRHRVGLAGVRGLLFGLLAAWLILGESVEPVLVVSLALVMVGLYLVTKPSRTTDPTRRLLEGPMISSRAPTLTRTIFG